MTLLFCVSAVYSQNPCGDDIDFVVKVKGDPDVVVEVPVIAPPLPPPPPGDELGPDDGDEYYDLYDEGYLRDVFLVHGLEGNGSSWDNMLAYLEHGHGIPGGGNFSGWKVDCWTPDYNLNQSSLWTIAAELEEEIMSYGIDEILSDNIIIAHSMGGLASRVMDMNLESAGQDKPFGAILTFGTPHLGAKAAENLVEGHMDDFIVNACNSLTDGPIVQFEETSTFFNIIGDIGLLTLQELKDTICNKVGDLAFEQIKQRYTAPVVDDLVPGSVNLETLNSFTPDNSIRRGAFYGTEDDDGTMAWRFFYSALAGVNFPGLGVGQAGFNNDAPAREQMEKVQTKYISQAEHWQEVYENWGLFSNWPCFNPFKKRVDFDTNGDGTFETTLCKSKEEVKALSNAWAKGEDWTLNFNEIWKNAIGMTGTQYSCQCTYFDLEGENEGESGTTYQTWVLEEGEICSDPDANYCSTFVSGTINKPSDAVVLQESATSFKGLNLPLYHMPGSNHLQMRNDGNTLNAMHHIFDGELSSWFMTPRHD